VIAASDVFVNNLSNSSPSSAKARGAPALLFEMMRSFVMLAKTLNLSQAVEELGSTRQTVRRHVSQLEDAMGYKLFDVNERRYSLTPKGADAVGPAQLLLDQGNVWYQGQVTYQDGMPQYKIEFPGGGNFYQQQKPLGLIWTDERPLLSAVLRAWTLSRGALEDVHFDAVRRYVMVFRNSPIGWVCTELGDQSSYATWFGFANARSSIGRVLGELPGGPEFGRLLSEPFNEVECDGGLRLDHIYTQIPRESGGAPVQICYARLLLGTRFPDGSFALVSVVDRHNNIQITGAPCVPMAPELVMELDTDLLNQK
jgi:biotin operon repressor